MSDEIEYAPIPKVGKKDVRKMLYAKDKQEAFLHYYLTPSSPTFMDGRASATKAGYGENTYPYVPSVYRENFPKIAKVLDGLQASFSKERMTVDKVLERLETAIRFLEGLMADPEKANLYKSFARMSDYIKILELHGKFLRMWSDDGGAKIGQFNLNILPSVCKCPHCGKDVNDRPIEAEVVNAGTSEAE